VSIVERDGVTVLDLASADPLLYAQLEPGRYDIIAAVHGQAVRRAIDVPADGQRVMRFEWPDSPRLAVPALVERRAAGAEPIFSDR
jgi:hypothetical protein